MIKIKKIFALGILLVSLSVYAQNCDKPLDAKPVRIYFVNGMDNKFLGNGGKKGFENHMILSKELLKNEIGPDAADYGNSFNFKENTYEELKQVAIQRRAQPVEFWQWMEHLTYSDPLGLVPHDVRAADINARIKKAKELNAKLYFTDKDLQVMVAQYLLDLQSGKKVVLVAHSQGNFYANNAYIHIKNNYPQYASSLGVVMVASPASFNASISQNTSIYHTNNSLDTVLQGVKLEYPILGYTHTYDYPFDDMNHAFNEVYMAEWGKTSIKPQVMSMINTLQTPVKHIDCATDAEIPVQIATWSATNITSTSAQLNGYLTSGKNTYVWFNSQIGSNNVASCASTQSVYPGGNYQVGQQYVTKTFPSSANVYYRACAIGVGNRISEGMVVHFQTPSAPPPPVSTTRNIVACASWNTLANPFTTGLYAYQAVAGTVNGVAFGSFGFNPSITSPQCRAVTVKRSFTNAFVFYLTSTHDNDIAQPYLFTFHDENGNYMNRSCKVGWTLQNRSSAVCNIAF